VAVLLAALPAQAQPSQSGIAAADPVTALVTRYLHNGEPLIDPTARLVVAQPVLAGAVITAANAAPPEVVGALDAALARAAIALLQTDPAAAQRIRVLASQSDNRSFAAAFSVAYAAAAPQGLAAQVSMPIALPPGLGLTETTDSVGPD
jgi:hypothetical protein